MSTRTKRQIQASFPMSSQPKSLAILGCGDLGLRLAALLPPDWLVTGVRREISQLPRTMAGLAADYSQSGSLAALSELAPDYVVATLKPLGRDAAGYRAGFVSAVENLLEGLGQHCPRGIIMVSSTRVYAEGDGGWVDEDSPLASDDPAAVAIVTAERRLLDSGLPVSLLRCGGIYGDPEGRLLSRVAGGEIVTADPVRYSNRVHRDDVAGFISYLLQRWQTDWVPASVYNVVDCEPAPQFEVESWLAGAMGVADPRPLLPPSARHKRCSNQALISSGYALRYPDYRQGYRAVLAGR